MPDVVITGIGVTSAVGQGKAAFVDGLMQGRSAFGVLRRPGRQVSASSDAGEATSTVFLGAEIESLSIPDSLSKKSLRTVSFSGQVALATLHEAWTDARLHDVDPERIGLIVGGSNFQQRELAQTQDAYRDRPYYLKPNYGHTFMDSDLCGVCTETFGIRGFAFTIGGASASGLVAVLQAVQAVESGRVDACVALGALMDLSFWELQAFRSIGAMGSDRYAGEPQRACRPFDRGRDGFIYGESCAAVVVERVSNGAGARVQPYARVAGGSMAVDGNRNPNPSLEGETRVIGEALRQAGVPASAIGYVNPHGTGSKIGDEIELEALRRCGLDHVHLNATKSITGHGLTAAGTVEVVATVLQMKESRIHPTRNLEEPIEPSYNWVRHAPVSQTIDYALSLSMGFGGINTAICLQRA